MRKGVLLVVAIPALLLLAGYLFVRIGLQTSIQKEEKKTGKVLPTPDTLGGKKVSVVDLRPLFIQRLQQLVQHSSNNLYDLSVGDMKVDVPASTVSLHNVMLKPNSKSLDSLKQISLLPESVLTISFQSLLIEGINLDDAINRKSMDYKLVKLVNPVIHIRQYKNGKKSSNDSHEAFTQRFLKEMQKLDIKKLVVEGGTIVSQTEGKKQKNQLNNVQVNMSNILLDANTRNDKQRFLFAKEATIDFKNYATQSSDGRYNFKIGSGTIKVPQQQITLQNLSIVSPLSKEQFEKTLKYSNDLYRLTFNTITINKADWWTLFNGKEFVADEVNMSGGKYYDYFDRSLPPTPRWGNFPQQQLMKVPFKINVAKLKMRNVDIEYEEFSPTSQQSGKIYIDNVNMDINHISNNNSKNQQPVTVSGSALFMHKVPLQATFSFNMANYKSGGFTATLNSNTAFGGETINSFAMPLGMMKIEKGTLQSISANVKGDEQSASGDVLMQYKDLKISVLEKEKNKTELDKKDFTSFFANTFVLKKSNPDGNKPPRKEPAEFKRDPNGGFFILVWKTILVGALRTLGAPTKIASKK